MIELYHLRSFPLLSIQSSAGSFHIQTSGLALRSTNTPTLIVLEFKPVNFSKMSGPRPPIQFLKIGSSGTDNPIPLTFDLFKSIYELRKGMMSSSLPRSVVALLDTTKAKLAGSIVRNDEQLDGAEIHIGINGDIVARELGRYIIRRSGDAA